VRWTDVNCGRRSRRLAYKKGAECGDSALAGPDGYGTCTKEIRNSSATLDPIAELQVAISLYQSLQGEHGAGDGVD